MNQKSPFSNSNRSDQLGSNPAAGAPSRPAGAIATAPGLLEPASGSSIFSPAPKRQSSANNGASPDGSAVEQPTVAEAVVTLLNRLGVHHAFGVSGGGIGPMWAALAHSPIQVLHFRHETGAGFAAVESYFANDRPVVVFTTTGPGITNVLTGLFAARGEGAKVILLSASTSSANRGRWACQETSPYTLPSEGIFTAGPLFHYAATLENSDQLPEATRRLALGLTRPGGFVAHLSVPTTVQTQPMPTALPPVTFSQSLATVGEVAIADCVRRLTEGPFAIWVGFGARQAAPLIRQLAERTGAAVMCSPRAKGVFPENHPQFLGVTGFSGHASVLQYMQEQRPLRTLVLGTRLGEPTSFWNPTMIPAKEFIHVDIDADVPGVAYPAVETVAIQSEIGAFVESLLAHWPEQAERLACSQLPRPEQMVGGQPRPNRLVRPAVLMEAIQRQVVEGSDALVMADAGNSFAWATHLLRFSQPGRYRISTGVGAMGHAATGVVGAALGRCGQAIAIVGDGAMLMQSEVSTAVKFKLPTVWIVLNDGRYNMCAQGMSLQGFKGVDTEIPQADFVLIARGLGADGIRVRQESDVEAALEKAMASPMPFIVDVWIDPTQPAPIGGRVQSLIAQGAIEAKGDK
ncbi:MAG: thiamine pyrophosphate-dependent enzyme [Pseudanabaenales cyanobacterium]|nr:thiamine pyrophosphate-dependent enzyme [Pseudanabaenales cyanobacterium]